MKACVKRSLSYVVYKQRQTSEAASKDPNHLIEYHLGRNPTFDPRRNDETHDHPSHLTPAYLAYNLDGLTSSLDTMGDLFTNTTQKLQQLTSLMQQYQACMGQARSANHEEELEDDRHYYNYYGGSYSLADWQRRTLASRDALVADMAGTYRSCTPLQSYPDPILVQAIRNLIDAIVQLNRMISGFTSATPQLQNIQGSLLSELDTAIQQMQQQLQNCQSQATQAPVAPTLAPTQVPTTQAQGVPTLAPTTQQPNTLAPATTAAPTEPPISGTTPTII
ncbi:unnamed protein product, partial [Cyprideis torosa]